MMEKGWKEDRNTLHQYFWGPLTLKALGLCGNSSNFQLAQKVRCGEWSDDRTLPDDVQAELTPGPAPPKRAIALGMV